jgi:hypothetical protein
LNPERHQVPIENLPDLIEDNVARYGIAPRKVWGWALEAIEKDVLRPVFPAGQSLDTKFSHGGMGPLTLRNIISARRKIDHYDPATENWAKTSRLIRMRSKVGLKRPYRLIASSGERTQNGKGSQPSSPRVIPTIFRLTKL